MFKTFRQKLLFWFLLLTSSNLVIIGLTTHYLSARDTISKSIELLERNYILALKDVNVQQLFFIYETKNDSFFASNDSKFLNTHKILSDSIYQVNDILLKSTTIDDLQMKDDLVQVKNLIQSIDSTFLKLINLVKVRGYKDFTLEGVMRKHAHWLEYNRTMDIGAILSLRRHEKDYIIRNDTIYVNKFNALAMKLLNKELKASQNDSSAYHLQRYQQAFNSIVNLDQEIGIKANTGLKKILDDKLLTLENLFSTIFIEAHREEKKLLEQLNFQYLSLALAMILLSTLLSYVISKKITQPLVTLTENINRFVESNFTAQENSLDVKSRDEIGKLTTNFIVMRNEVIDRFKFFIQKVEERTADLAQANQKLVKLNEANGRFVPKEFLQFLSKESIEDVMLGDQVEHEMTVMFTDIKSFTKISESLTPQENFDFINGYLKEIVPVIRKHNGFIDKYIGDSIMALFPGSPDGALMAALEFEKAVEQFNVYLASNGREKICIGSGIHTGKLILGTIGHDHRLETTVISDAVNIASRLEGLTRHYNARIIASDQTIQKLNNPENFNARYLETVRVKGKSKSLDIYEILSPKENKSKKAYQQQFDFALQLLREKKLLEARNIFAELALAHPEDGALQVLLHRCDEYLSNELPEIWDPVKDMVTKE